MSDELKDITEKLQQDFPEIGIKSIEVNKDTGTSTFYLDPTPKTLAFIKDGSALIPKNRSGKEQATTVMRDFLRRTDLDMMLIKTTPYEDDPLTSFNRAITYYYNEGILGTVINLFASLAAQGFENDIDDPAIKNFYDIWCLDVRMSEVIEWIFLDFFKVGHVHVYKALAKYEPRVSNISPIAGKTIPKSTGAKKNVWSKGQIPVSYTILNPTLVKVEGSLLFNQTRVVLTPPPELAELLKKQKSELSTDERNMLDILPNDLKKAALANQDFPLDSNYVSAITYRKQPYERYARPKSMRIFDSIEYKTALRNADLSTLDGISNYILKVTIGSDQYPVTTDAELQAVAALFNTSSKSFDVVWNHTLKIEKIVSPEIGQILGKAKYEQVNEDITGGLGMSRAFIDGGGKVGVAEAGLVIKGITEEINYARKQVERWLYTEYQQIAEAMNFERFPRIRWDESILKDTILFMSTVSQLVDRRMLSYQTALELLGFDYATEKQNMEAELELVTAGTFGLSGSPFQQSKGVQPTQGAPKGTPSNGRPTGKVSKKKDTETNPQKITKDKIDTTSQTKSSLNEMINKMDEEELDIFMNAFTAEMNNKGED